MELSTFFFFFQAEDGIRDLTVTGVQTCALPISLPQLSDVEEELRRLAGGRAAILRVSTECYTCYHWLPGVLQRFARRFPQVDVQIVAEATHHPVPALFDGRIDLAIVSNDDHDDRLAYVPLFSDELVALLRPDHPLSPN